MKGTLRRRALQAAMRPEHIQLAVVHCQFDPNGLRALDDYKSSHKCPFYTLLAIPTANPTDSMDVDGQRAIQASDELTRMSNVLTSP